MLDSSRVDLYSERTDTFLNEDYSDHSAKPMNASLDGLTIDASATDHEKVSFDLVQLQQQEEDMRKAADALETRVSELFEQIKQLRQ